VASPVYFFHGLEGSPQGVKGNFLRQKLPGMVIPSLPMDLAGRAKIIEELIQEPSWLLGSSLGGLSAILFALKHPHRVKGMVLVAPAVGFFDPRLGSPAERQELACLSLPVGMPIRILAAQEDEIIPLEAITALVQRSPLAEVRLQVFADNHSLNQHLEEFWQAFAELYAEA